MITSKVIVDIPANIGGLLGLFMGFSVFSIIEIFYFLSIRPYCNYLKDAGNRRQTFQRMAHRFKHLTVKETTNLNSNYDNAIKMNNLVFPHLN